ncbi:hypothetical protein VTN96DRAFT_7786 [Rasamsonia emersonii]
MTMVRDNASSGVHDQGRGGFSPAQSQPIGDLTRRGANHRPVAVVLLDAPEPTMTRFLASFPLARYSSSPGFPG